tara:strand:+ start:511 stop:789 length:279 start_codon:yes stop_codon:yes gene_type:complete
MAGAYGGYQPGIGSYGFSKQREAMSQAKSPLRGLMDIAEDAEAREQQARDQAEDDARFNQLMQRMRRNPGPPPTPEQRERMKKQIPFFAPLI